MILDAMKTRDGGLYLAGAAITFLVTAFVTASTVRAYMDQWALREAVHSFHRGGKDASMLLAKLRREDTGDAHTQASVRILLGCYNYDRAHKNPKLLDAAERLFEEALQIDPGRPSAAIGQACVRLRLAEVKDRDARIRDAAGAISDLDQAVGSEGGPDANYLRGAALLLQGQHEQALRLLDDPNPSEAPSLQGTGARLWNLGIAQVLAKNPNAYASFGLGYLLRSHPIPAERAEDLPPKDQPVGRPGDAPKLLSLIYRHCVTREGQDPAEHLARCDDAARYLAKFSRGPGALGRGQAGRYLPHSAEEPPLYNALGIGYFRAGAYLKAAGWFAQASKATKGFEPLYELNKAWSYYKAGLAISPGGDKELKKRRTEILDQAADVFEQVCQRLFKQEGREATIRLARTNAAAIRIELGDFKAAAKVYGRYVKGDPQEVEWRRVSGILFDRSGNKKAAIENYRAAVRLQHPDSADLERRIAELRAPR